MGPRPAYGHTELHRLVSPEHEERTGHLSNDGLGHERMIALQIAVPAEHDEVGAIVTGGADDLRAWVSYRESQTNS
jgi:hypothetical protein